MYGTSEQIKEQIAGYQDRIKSLQDLKKKPIPTPHFMCVRYFGGGIVSDKTTFTAIVTMRESAGQVSLTVFRPKAQPMCVSGVKWLHHPDVAGKEGTPAVRESGLWDYVPSQNIRKEHYDLHTIELDRQIRAVEGEIAKLRAELETRQASRPAEKAASEPEPVAG